MSWNVELTPTARRMLGAVTDRRVRRLLAERIDGLAHDEKQGKPLRGELARLRSLRAAGQRYRILYRVEAGFVYVLEIAIGLRRAGGHQDIYALAKKLLRLRKEMQELIAQFSTFESFMTQEDLRRMREEL